MEEKRHPDFDRIYMNFVSEYGEERGRTLYYAWLNGHGLDDTKPLEPQLKKIFREWIVGIGESYGKPLRIKGYAIHAGATRNWNLYLEDELRKAADSLIGKPIYIEHVSAGGAVGKVLAAGWDEGEKAVWFEAEIYDDDAADKVRAGVVKHVSIAADYDILEPFDSIRIPLGLEFRELSLVAVPGDPEANIMVVEKLLQTHASREGGGGAIGVEKVEEREWDTAFINSLPDAAFAVIEPAYERGETEDKRCRHLPHHGPDVKNPDEHSTVDLPHLRNALARCSQIVPVTGSISAEELRSKARAHLEKHAEALGIGGRGEEGRAPPFIGEEAVSLQPQPVGELLSAGDAKRGVENRGMSNPKGIVDEAVGLVVEGRRRFIEAVKSGSLREQWTPPFALPEASAARVSTFVRRSEVLAGKPGDIVNIPYVRDFDMDVLASIGDTLTPKGNLYGVVQAGLKEAAACTLIPYADVEKISEDLLVELEGRFSGAALRAVDKYVFDTLIADTGIPEVDKSVATVNFDADWIVEAVSLMIKNRRNVEPGDCLLVVSPGMYEALMKDIVGSQAIIYARPDLVREGRVTELFGVRITVSHSLPEHDTTNHKLSAYLIHRDSMVFAPKRELLIETERDTVNRRVKLTGSIAFAVGTIDKSSIVEIKTPATY